MTFLTSLDRSDASHAELNLHQRGRAGLELLGSLQKFSSSRIRDRARDEFQSRPQAAELDAAVGVTDPAVQRGRVASGRRLAARSQAYRLERFHQRFVASEIFNRAIPAVERKRAVYERYFGELPPGPGRLELDPSVSAPRHWDKVDWHLEPEGWDGYDLYGAVFAFAIGPLVFRHGGYAAVEVGDDILAQRRQVVRQFRRERYRRIYEPGCGGFSTMAAVHEVFPSAELVASDLSTLLLRNGHAIARRAGVPVTFRQRDARRTGEADSSFDGVILYALLHEMPVAHARAILREMYRILEPGGDLVSSDPPPFHAVPTFQAVTLDWETRHRGEPFFSAACLTDWSEELRRVGFVDVEAQPLAERGYPWVIRARKPE